MFSNKAFQARVLRVLGAILVLSSGYFVYLDNQLVYSDAKISHYEQQNPVIRFSASPTEQITFKLEQTWREDKYPIGSTIVVRYPRGEYNKLEYVSPLLQWAFYIILPIGLTIFFIGARLTIKVRKVKK